MATVGPLECEIRVYGKRLARLVLRAAFTLFCAHPERWAARCMVVRLDCAGKVVWCRLPTGNSK